MTAFADLGPTIETDRLLLRVQRAEDFEHFAELLDDEEACRYIGGTLPRAAAWRKFLQMPGAWAVQGFGMFAVIEKSSGDWLGNIGPWKPVGWPGNEVGWALRRAAWGKGYATEAAVAAIDWAFAHGSVGRNCVPSANQHRIALDSARTRPSSSSIIGTLPLGFFAR